jgi:hypothetical protein
VMSSSEFCHSILSPVLTSPVNNCISSLPPIACLHGGEKWNDRSSHLNLHFTLQFPIACLRSFLAIAAEF